MNAADLARLELAKRAFRATEANAAEVQRGVRRARLALQRPKARRRWFSKGAVMLVLAVGGLAYAKPQGLGDLVSQVVESRKTSGKQGAGAALLRASDELHAPATRSPSLRVVAEAPSVDGPTTAPASSPGAAPPAANGAKSDDESRDKPAPVGRNSALAASTSKRSGATATPEAPPSDAPASAPAISDWGRVGQALADGDETKALAALSELAESDDQGTRDKADLGRAQLYMANGDREGACALARQLTHRRAGSRIERQAQVILKSCAR